MGVVWELKKTLGVVQMWLGWKVVRVETRSLKFFGKVICTYLGLNTVNLTLNQWIRILWNLHLGKHPHGFLSMTIYGS